MCNNADQGKTRLMPYTLATLEAYHFPGNVRELKNILKRAMALCEDHRITVNNIAFPSRQQNRASVPAGRPVSVALEATWNRLKNRPPSTNWNALTETGTLQPETSALPFDP